MRFGQAFSDYLTVEHRVISQTMKDQGAKWWSGMGRVLVLAAVLLLSFFILFWRLVELTVVKGYEFARLADINRTRQLVHHAPRGLFLDRTGRPLVANEPVSRQETGNFLIKDFIRRYLYPSTSHVLGYLGELSEAELSQEYYVSRNYLPGDRIGRMGAEATFEERLRGRDGKELVEVDASGKFLRSLGQLPAVAGEDVWLSIDVDLMEAAAKAFPGGQRGAVVVTKPDTGEILTLYSSPGFAADKFSTGVTTEEYQDLLNDPDSPMFNRAIGGVYPPGSTFKLVTAMAGLEEVVIDGATTVEDTGEIVIGLFRFPNWYFVQYGKTEGTVDLIKALGRSNDIFFYKVGEWVGITKLAVWANKVGIGKPLGIEISGEAGGLMPDPAWKREYFTSPEDLQGRSNEWYLGDTYHVAIGQGYLLTTPLQVNAWTNVIANGGKLCKPTIENQKSKIKMQNCKDLNLKQETINLITQGMKTACETGGTGWPFFNFNVPVACKTGTAEFGPSTDSGQARTHAWFTAFAPIAEPEISVTVLVEGAGEGSNIAAPVAKKILEEWFSR